MARAWAVLTKSCRDKTSHSRREKNASAAALKLLYPSSGLQLSLDPPSILVGSGGPPFDLDRRLWAWMGRRAVRLCYCRSSVGPDGAVVGQAAAGGPQVASNS